MNQNNNEKGITKGEMVELLDKVISVLDERIDSVKKELKTDILDLRNEMNQRFLAVDGRLLRIETHMVQQEEFKPLATRVERLELVNL